MVVKLTPRLSIVCFRIGGVVGRCSVRLTLGVVLRGSRTIINDKRVSFDAAIIQVQSVLAILRLVLTRLCALQTTSQLSYPKVPSVGSASPTRNACRILPSVIGDAVAVEDLEGLCVELDVQCIE